MLEDDKDGSEMDGWSKAGWESLGGDAERRFRSATASRAGGSISRWFVTVLAAANEAKVGGQKEGEGGRNDGAVGGWMVGWALSWARRVDGG